MEVDADMTRLEALTGSAAPVDVLDMMEIVDVRYHGFDSQLHQGQIVIHQDLTEEVLEIFQQLRVIEFPIEKVIPIVEYDWDDASSIQDNNSSAFNYRMIEHKDKLSNHSFGVAIDINPVQNPYIDKAGNSWPSGYEYDEDSSGALVDGGKAVDIFLQKGWEWGGHWGRARGYFDYQHFEKTGE